MNWDAWLEFLQMGGYALHVWGSYLVLPALVLIELVLLLLRKREIFGHLGWKRDEAARS
jgi:heme exporter protein CcmD